MTVARSHNYATSLCSLGHLEEAKELLRKIMPVARRELGEENDTTLRMRELYAIALYANNHATLDDLREAETTLEEVEPIVRRVFGGAHPLLGQIEDDLRRSRGLLAALEAPPPDAS